MPKCTCVYATSANTASVRSGHEMGGYLKKECEVCKAERLRAAAEEARKRMRQTVVVPVNPTADMPRAGGEAIRWYEQDATCRAVYAAMLAHAPAARGNYRPGTPLNEILKDCWSRSFTMEQTLQEVEGMGFKVDASLVEWFNGQWDADFEREMSRQGRVDKLMEQAQVFASAWASVDGPFDTGGMLALAEQERENLRRMIQEKDDGKS
ncbi:hypothetical protein FQZ97_714800 [compost metagenome]